LALVDFGAYDSYPFSQLIFSWTVE